LLNIQDGGGQHLEKSQKSRFRRNGLTDLYKIWYADAKWLLSSPIVKEFEFQTSKIAGGRHFENR